MWDSSHTHTHHTINKIGASQSYLLKSLTSSLGPTLWGSISESTRDYQVGSDTICNNPRKSASHICAIPQKDQSQLRLFAVVNKTQFNPVNTRCGTHHTPTPTHITQSIKLGHHTTQPNTLQKSFPSHFLSKVFHPPRFTFKQTHPKFFTFLLLLSYVQKCKRYNTFTIIS